MRCKKDEDQALAVQKFIALWAANASLVELWTTLLDKVKEKIYQH